MITVSELSDKIRHYRKSKNYTQEKLAEKIFVSRKTISSWETGRSFPDFKALIQLSDIFNISVDTLLKDDDKALEHFEEQDKQAKKDIKITKVSYYLNFFLLFLSYIHMFKVFGFHTTLIPLALVINMIIFFSHYSNWISFKNKNKLSLFIGSFIVLLILNSFTMAFNVNFQKTLIPDDMIETLGTATGEFILILLINVSLTLAIFFYPYQKKK